MSSLETKTQQTEKKQQGTHLGMTTSAEVGEDAIERVEVASGGGSGGGPERLA